MWTDDIAVTEGGKITFIGRSVLKCLDLKRHEHFGFPDGYVQSGDILIYVSGDPDMIRRTCSALVIRPKDEGSALTVIIAALNNADVLPVMAGAGLDNGTSVGTDAGADAGAGTGTGADAGTEVSGEARDRACFSTIFERTSVELSAGEDCVSVKADSHSFKFRLDDEHREAAIILRSGEVIYFTHPGAEEAESIPAILESGRFAGFADMEKLSCRRLDSVVTPKISEALKRLEKAETGADAAPSVHVCEYEANMVIESRRFGSDRGEVVMYRFIETVDAERDLIEDSKKYAALSGVETEIRLNSTCFNNFRLWGSSDKVRNVELLLEKCSGTNCTVLLEGESGTGKTVLARAIHDSSRRSGRPFVQVNCAAIPYQLMESELFGYEEGAFTGAKRGGKKGLFEMAYGGTLFLDEITEIPLQLQGRLLEALQSKSFYHVGGTKKLSVDVRLIVATNRDLKKLVSEKKFREDLYYRINVFSIVIPPLRERMDSIQAIISDILPGLCDELEVGTKFLSGGALSKIKGYDWPGNIRELENVLEKAAILSDGKVIMDSDIILPDGVRTGAGSEFSSERHTLKEQKEDLEKEAITRALVLFDGDKTAAAKYLGIGRTSIFEKIGRYGLEDHDSGKH